MISAIIMAAGQSKRMGKPKINLPWGDTTVLGQIVRTLLQAEVEEVLVVTGGVPIEGLESWQNLPVRIVNNPDYAQSEMLTSLQIGLESASPLSQAALVVLGDQPQLEEAIVRRLRASYEARHALLVVPSYQMRRGHPWILDRTLWESVLELLAPDTLRDFLNQHASSIHYLNCDSCSILLDLDTPSDYERFRPGGQL